MESAPSMSADRSSPQVADRGLIVPVSSVDQLERHDDHVDRLFVNDCRYWHSRQRRRSTVVERLHLHR